MRTTSRRLGERGAGMAEAIVLLATIAIASIAAIRSFGGRERSGMDRAGDCLVAMSTECGASRGAALDRAARAADSTDLVVASRDQRPARNGGGGGIRAMPTSLLVGDDPTTMPTVTYGGAPVNADPDDPCASVSTTGRCWVTEYGQIIVMQETCGSETCSFTHVILEADGTVTVGTGAYPLDGHVDDTFTIEVTFDTPEELVAGLPSQVRVIEGMEIRSVVAHGAGLYWGMRLDEVAYDPATGELRVDLSALGDDPELAAYLRETHGISGMQQHGHGSADVVTFEGGGQGRRGDAIDIASVMPVDSAPAAQLPPASVCIDGAAGAICIQ